MDYESKILLNNLIDALSNPEWWNVIATFAAAIVAAVITYIFGKRQEALQQQHLKLQEQQTKQQEYKLYKSLYKVVSDANIEISNFLFMLYVHISNAPKKDEVEILLQRAVEQLQKVDETILQCAIDFNLKFPNEKTLVHDYRYTIVMMYNICTHFSELYKSGNILDTELVSERDYTPIQTFLKDDNLVSVILAHIKDEVARHREYMFLNDFVNYKTNLLGKNYLNMITERCKTE